MAELKLKTSYDEIIKNHPKLKDVIDQKSWDYISSSDENTIAILKKHWKENVEQNIKSKRLKRHGGLDRDCIGFGKNKAVIGIGAGASLNKNMDTLKAIHDIDGVKHPDDRNFIFVACNHMFKPLLRAGIIPDFVMIADASEVVMEQLTKDVPESGRNCILISGIHCSPKVLKRWEKQGRDIRFYLTTSEGVLNTYKSLVTDNPDSLLIQQGGNVLNSLWSVSLKFFKSTVFMALGNDMSYELSGDRGARRDSYYADKDYSSNLATGRDEAECKDAWMGFTLKKRNIISLHPRTVHDYYDIELDPVGTSPNLWVYKTWLEAHVVGNDNLKIIPFHYYNCSEGGIAGVMCKGKTPEEREDINNWFMLDDITRRWKTRTFSDAISEFLKAKEMLKWGIHAVPRAIDLAVKN